MILDTNAISALASKEPAIMAALANTPRVCVTLITLGEFHFGLLGSTMRNELDHWLTMFLERAEVLAASQETLRHYAAIRQELKIAGTPIPANDVWIAALVRQHAMPILSRDAHFDMVAGIKRLTW